MTTRVIDQDVLDDVVRGVVAFVEAEVVPRQESNHAVFQSVSTLFADDGRMVPAAIELRREVRTASARAGFFNMCVPESLGGGGLGSRVFYEAMKAVVRRCGAHDWLSNDVIAHWSKGPSHLFEQASPELQSRVLTPLMAGDDTMCFAMSEPDAGTDVWMMHTLATVDGSGWRINGVKQWITNAPYADHALVFAVTDPDAVSQRTGGISAFVVPTSDPGFEIESIIRLYGEPGGVEGIVRFTDVRVERWQQLGELGRGLELAMSGISRGRLYNTAVAIGLGSWALATAFEYCTERQTFGAPIADRQGITFPLAESVMEIEAADALAVRCATTLDAGRSARTEIAMAKGFAIEAALRAIDRALQAHGAMGLTTELGLVHAWHRLRATRIADGSAEMLRRQVVRDCLSGRHRL